jgi:hypothetical protein
LGFAGILIHIFQELLKKKIQRESKPPATLSKAIWLHIKEKTLLDKLPIYTWQWNC